MLSEAKMVALQAAAETHKAVGDAFMYELCIALLLLWILCPQAVLEQATFQMLAAAACMAALWSAFWRNSPLLST